MDTPRGGGPAGRPCLRPYRMRPQSGGFDPMAKAVQDRTPELPPATAAAGTRALNRAALRAERGKAGLQAARRGGRPLAAGDPDAAAGGRDVVRAVAGQRAIVERAPMRGAARRPLKLRVTGKLRTACS